MTWELIDEDNVDQMRDVPTLLAYHWFDLVDQWSIWCTGCSRWHTHGGLGHRYAHCGRQPSGPSVTPVYPDGYVLVDSGETVTEREIARNKPPATIVAPCQPTTLYRLFASDEALLYIGIAGNPGRRFEQHAGDKPWWGYVARITVEHFPTRDDALMAERAAIHAEQPLHNLIHNRARCA